MKKLTGIILGIVSIVMITGITVYATPPQMVIHLYYYLENRIEALILIGLMIINCALMLYNLVKKNNKKIILLQQILEIVFIVYFNLKINIDFNIWDWDEEWIKMMIRSSFSLCFMGELLFIILELIALKKKNEKLWRKFIIIATSLLIAIVINKSTEIYRAEKINRGELFNNNNYAIIREDY